MYSYTPKKVFNKKIANFFKKLKVGITFNVNQKYKKYLVVTLKAPKHFKVGRNHFNIFRKKLALNYVFSQSNCQLHCRGAALAGALVTLVQRSKVLTPSAPFCEISSVRYNVEVTAQFCIL